MPVALFIHPSFAVHLAWPTQPDFRRPWTSRQKGLTTHKCLLWDQTPGRPLMQRGRRPLLGRLLLPLPLSLNAVRRPTCHRPPARPLTCMLSPCAEVSATPYESTWTRTAPSTATTRQPPLLPPPLPLPPQLRSEPPFRRLQRPS